MGNIFIDGTFGRINSVHEKRLLAGRQARPIEFFDQRLAEDIVCTFILGDGERGVFACRVGDVFFCGGIVGGHFFQTRKHHSQTRIERRKFSIDQDMEIVADVVV